MDPNSKNLQSQVDRLTRENARLRSQLAVTQRWYPPPELEHAFQAAHGWQCLSVTLASGSPTLILIAGAPPGREPRDPDATGRVWRHLLTAAPTRGRIGPFARASMPAQLLGYLREQDGRAIIVLNKDLPRGQVARAAHMLMSTARIRRPQPRLLGLSMAPLSALCGLLRDTGGRGLLAAAVLVIAVIASMALTPHHFSAKPTCAAPASATEPRPKPAPHHDT